MRKIAIDGGSYTTALHTLTSAAASATGTGEDL